jgi:carbamoyl-phosphate synthase large subunit
MPYTCKTTGVNMVELAAQAMLGRRFRDVKMMDGLPPLSHYGVKVPQFSFMRLSGADPILGVEMVSTGEVACLGENFTDALMKALQSSEFKMPSPGGGVLITVGGEELKKKIIPLAKALGEMGYKLYATEHTAEALREAGIERVRVLHKVGESHRRPNILDYLIKGRIDFVINIPKIASNPISTIDDEYTIRRLAVEYNIPVVTTLELATALVNVLEYRRNLEPTIRSLNEYMDSLLWKYW